MGPARAPPEREQAPLGLPPRMMMRPGAWACPCKTQPPGMGSTANTGNREWKHPRCPLLAGRQRDVQCTHLGGGGGSSRLGESAASERSVNASLSGLRQCTELAFSTHSFSWETGIAQQEASDGQQKTTMSLEPHAHTSQPAGLPA